MSWRLAFNPSATLRACPACAYDTGLANYLEILIADQQLFDQELLLARARGSQLTAVVQLYRALGGGWQP